jgi:hypothetical protein
MNELHNARSEPPPWPARRPPRPRLIAWKEHRQNTLRGFASVQFASGIQIAEIQVHVAGSRMWASPPARPWIDDGSTVTDPETGKVRYQQLISFSTHGCRRRWSDQVIRALLEVHPGALTAEVVA